MPRKPKAHRGPPGTFVPSDTGGRVDASRQVPTRRQHCVRPEDRDWSRNDTSGKVDPTKYDRRRAARIRRQPDPERTDAFRPEVPKRLNDQGKRNRSMELPYHRLPYGLTDRHLPFLVERGTLWQTRQELHLSWCDDPKMPTLGWSAAQRANGPPAIAVPAGAFITYAGTRRVDARIRGEDERHSNEVGRCLQAVFLYGQHRCVVWDFNVVEPIPDDDDGPDEEEADDGDEASQEDR